MKLHVVAAASFTALLLGSSCGSVPTGTAIDGGSDASACSGTELTCDDTCVDPATSNAHCGAVGDCLGASAGAVCNVAGGQSCSNATCACPAGQLACDGICSASTPSSLQAFAFTGAIQTFVVPCTASPMHIAATGAQGGTAGGLGAAITGDFALTPGTVLQIVVGEQGHDQVGGDPQNSGGGGGGTFVYIDDATLLVAAGGGGGKCNFGGSAPLHATAAGQADTAGGAASDGTQGGVDGGPGATGNRGGDLFDSGGGAGWLSSAAAPFGGANRAGDWAGGQGFCGGGAGCGGGGGFGGGGGGGNDFGGGGGGGGFSGGGGGGDPDHGGGGGSFNAGTNQTNLAGQHGGNGTVTISW